MKKRKHTIKLVSFSLLSMLGTSLFIVVLEVQRAGLLS
jgi:hypothetical protein